MTNLIGQSIGHYHILEQLGEGGMAVVYKAYDVRLDREVAIKVILPSKQTSDKFVKRFEREAKLLARLSHPNIVKILDYGTFEGTPYLVMEYIRGKTLKSRLPGNFSWQEAFRIVSSIARALDAVHRQKIIHRDIKPSNILMGEDGQAFVSDFGVAKIYEDDETFELTGTGVGVGTPEYMSPEQVMGHTVDARSDVYSLGILLYQLITQRTPFRADTPMAVGFKQVSEPLPRPKSHFGILPDQVEYVLIKALAKKPEDRYQSMAEFASAMEKLLIPKAGEKEHHGISKNLKDKSPSASWIKPGLVIGALILFMGFVWFVIRNWQNRTLQESPALPTATNSQPTEFLPSVTSTVTLDPPQTVMSTEPVVNNVSLPVPDQAEMLWSFTDTRPGSMYKAFDLKEGTAWLVGNRMEIYVRVADIPERLLVSRTSLAPDTMEYAWRVNIDINGDSIDDYQTGIFVFKPAGSSEHSVSPLDVKEWAQFSFFKNTGQESWEVDNGTVVAEMDPVTDIIHITTTSNRFTRDMKLTVETNSGSQGESISFIDPNSPVIPSATPVPSSSGQADSSDIWNVEIHQSTPDQMIVNFEYQIHSSIDLSDVWIGASPEGCYENISFAPVRPVAYSGKYTGVQGVQVWLNNQGACNLDKLSVFIFSEKDNGSDYYKEEFNLPISLEK